ncbi:MAG TPA: hypothetical protein DCS66_10040, partial [Flavobacteriaceae bacterium]|nr:hypothetical protein [Flavobacteriaceae bacterium]
MFTSLASYLKYGNTFSGIEVTTIEAKTNYFGVTAQKKKGEFENITFCQGDSFSKIAKAKESISHAFLVINTDKVLIKEIGLEKDTPKALSTAFPGLSTDDFYFEIIHSFEKSYVAVCRKEEVELILKEAAKEKISIIGFSLGFSKIQGLLSILNGNEIVLTRQTLQIDQENIVSYSNESKINKEYLIDGIKVPSNYLLALASLFGYISQTSTFSNTATKNKFLEKGYSERNTFRKTLGVGLGFLLIVFLVNMFYYTSYRKQYQQLEEETQLASVQKETLLKK